MTDSAFTNNTTATATKLGTLAFEGNTFDGPTTARIFDFDSVGQGIDFGGSNGQNPPFPFDFTTDVIDHFTFDPFLLETVSVNFNADTVGTFANFVAFIPISGVSKVTGAVVSNWYGGEHADGVSFPQTEPRNLTNNQSFNLLGDLQRGDVAPGIDWSEATWVNGDDVFAGAKAVWTLDGTPVVFQAFGFHHDGTSSQVEAKGFVPDEVSYSFTILPQSGSPTLEQTFAANTSAALGIATAYQTLLNGVPNQAGFVALINTAVSTNFGAGSGPMFNQENIFINLINNLVQGNTDARNNFDGLAAGATLEAKVTSLYNAIVPPSQQSDEGLAFITRPDGLAFYQTIAAERGVAGTDGAAVVALASLLNIAVTNDFGVGNAVNDLTKAVAAGSAALPTSGTALTQIEVADGTEFDGDDAAAIAITAAALAPEVSHADFAYAPNELEFNEVTTLGHAETSGVYDLA